MTAKERAEQAVVRSIVLVSDRGVLTAASTIRNVETAIREAVNEKLEEAARAAERQGAYATAEDVRAMKAIE